MFDIAPSEFLLVAIVALVVIGPKDLPKALRVLGYWVGRARSVARQFRSGFDNMVREAELAEMEKKWAEENKRIMAEHGADGPAVADQALAAGDGAPATEGDGSASSAEAEAPFPPDDGVHAAPVMVEKPQVAAAPPGASAHRADDAMS